MTIASAVLFGETSISTAGTSPMAVQNLSVRRSTRSTAIISLTRRSVAERKNQLTRLPMIQACLWTSSTTPAARTLCRKFQVKPASQMSSTTTMAKVSALQFGEIGTRTAGTFVNLTLAARRLTQTTSTISMALIPKHSLPNLPASASLGTPGTITPTRPATRFGGIGTNGAAIKLKTKERISARKLNLTTKRQSMAPW